MLAFSMCLAIIFLARLSFNREELVFLSVTGMTRASYLAIIASIIMIALDAPMPSDQSQSVEGTVMPLKIMVLVLGEGTVLLATPPLES